MLSFAAMPRLTTLTGAIGAFGVATAVLLSAQPAAALGFSFSFDGIKGLIKGLDDNTTTAPLSIEVTESPIGGVGSYIYAQGNGFEVNNGVINSATADWGGFFEGDTASETLMLFSSSGAFQQVGAVSRGFTEPVFAQLLSFSFSFNGVEGFIRDLADNATTAPDSIEVTQSPIGGVGSYIYAQGNGFEVNNGVINSATADWGGFFEGDTASETLMLFSSSGAFQQVGAVSRGFTEPVFASLQRAPADVPGPLPVFGAAAAFGFSRKLRKRLNQSRIAVSTSPKA